ncbi:hypothetical protein NKR23_g3924 [Pleurostoma richardsiae]|uniref:Myb-like DNA-binding domain-containing protein n=1 Tax=Pleurostoma richardsiae TaxID=41990 RepID=A0AA38RWU2_9PEZI|nr:hypothetical protein NKR23_g3924 [Pleurostoma richardsiae]
MPDSTASKLPQPTPAEAHFFFNILKNLKNKPEIDWDGVAADSGLKNGSTASVRFRQIKQKLGLHQGSGQGGKTAGAKKAPATPKSGQSKVTKTPRKKAGTSKAKSTPWPAHVGDDGDLVAPEMRKEAELEAKAEDAGTFASLGGMPAFASAAYRSSGLEPDIADAYMPNFEHGDYNM